MDNNTAYKTQAIDINLLSVLDIAKDGKVVSAEKWVELWNLVFQHINKIDAFCVDMQSTLDNWHESEIALNEIVEDMQMKYAALSTGFIHYGENTPENPHIMLWVRRMNDISTHCFLTNEDVDSELSDTSTNPVQNKVANAALNNKMDKNNPTGTGSFSLNRKSDTVIGNYSFAEGSNGQATGTASHTEGNSTTASGNSSHAEGSSTQASGSNSHAEGERTTASGKASHTEGYLTTALGDYSHAEGRSTTASGETSHTEGYLTTASGDNTHAEGKYTKALADCQHVQGRYNIEDNNNIYADIIGNGSSNADRSNAATVDWQGNAWYAGDVYVDSTSGTNKDAGSKKLATEEYVATGLTSKVDKEEGKGLSTNDFTNDYKTKLDGIQTGTVLATTDYVDGKLVQKQDYFADVHDITSGAYAGNRGIDFKDSDGNTQGQLIITYYGIKLTNLDYPSDDGDAATKYYVDQIKEGVLSAPQTSDCILALDLASETIGIPYSSNSLPNSIPQRDENGSFQVWDPINEYDVVPKHYVDNIVGNIDQTYNSTSENAQSGKAVAEAVSSKADKLTELTELILGDDAPTGYFILKKGAIQNYVEKYYSNGSTQNTKYSMICGTDTLIHIYRTQVSEDGSYEIYVKYLGGYDKYVKKATSDSGLTHTGTMTYISYASQVSVEEAVTEAKGYTDTKIGSIDTALDSIIVLQNSYIGGNA